MKDTIYKLKKDLVIQEVEDELFIFDGETSILHTLNQTAADLFKKLKKGSSVENLSKYLVQEYEISLEKALKDSSDFIEKLKKKKLVTDTKPKKTAHE